MNTELFVAFLSIIVLQSFLFAQYRISGLLSGAIFGLIFGPMSLDLIKYSPELDILMNLSIFVIIFGLSLVIPSGEFFKKYLIPNKSLAIVPTIITSLIVFVVSISLDFALHISMILVIIFVTVSTSINSIAMNYFVENNLQKSHVMKLFFVGAMPNNLIAISIFMVLLNIFDAGNISIVEIFISILEVFGLIVISVAFARYFYPLVFFKPLDILDQKTKRKKDKRLTNNSFLITLFLLINASILGYISNLIGFHAFFGAYLSTIFIPEKFLVAPLKEQVSNKISNLNGYIFMPIFGLILSLYLDSDILFDYDLFIPFAILTIAIIGVQFLSNLILSRINTLSVYESIVVSVGSLAKAELGLVILFVSVSYGLIDYEIFTSSVILIVILNLISWVGFKKIEKSNLDEK